MAGKKTFDNILMSLIFFVALLASSCHTTQYVSQKNSPKNVCGTYVFNQIGYQNEIVEIDTLVLEEDGTYYCFTNSKKKDLNDMVVYPTKGTWTTCGNSVILNSIIPCDEDSCFIQEIRTDKKDENLIILEVIRLSTEKPMSNYTVLSIYDEHYDSIANTDSCGRVIFRREHTSELDISDPNGMRIIAPPRMGYKYRVYYRDCYLRIHNNEKLVFRENTLTLSKIEIVGFNILGWKKYKICEYRYIKVADSIGH